MRKEEIKERIEEIKEEISGSWAADFVADWWDSLAGIRYLSDAVSEYADNNVSIYYCDIDKYYQEHIKESSDALKEYGYNLSDFEDLEEACRKGAQIAEYDEIYRDIMQYEDELEELQELLEELNEIEEQERGAEVC